MTVQLTNESEWIRFAPLLLTIAGWYFVNKQSNLRETRKEHRALVDLAKKQILEISANAQKYIQEKDSKLAPDIKWAMEALEIELCRIPDFGRGSHVLICFVKFVDACTGGEFEQAHRAARPPDSPQAQAVVETRNRLIEAIEKWFSDRYA